MKYAIGVDIGTSGTKSVMFDETGRVMASASAEYPLWQEKNGYAEQEPADWYNASVKTIKKIIEDSGVDASDITGVGFWVIPVGTPPHFLKRFQISTEYFAVCSSFRRR